MDLYMRKKTYNGKYNRNHFPFTSLPSSIYQFPCTNSLAFNAYFTEAHTGYTI